MNNRSSLLHSIGGTLLIPFLLFLGVAGGCTLDNDVEEDTLTLSDQGPLAFTNEGGETQITINTNRSNPTAISTAPWVETVVSGRELIVTVAENDLPLERKASVTILAGTAIVSVDVIQSGADVILNGLPQTLSVKPWTDHYTLDIETNVSKWTASCDQDWVEVTPIVNQNQIRLTIDENTETTERTASILLSSEESEQETEVIIKQEGAMLYILPYLDYKGGLRSYITLFEEERRSTPKLSSASYLDFITLSPLFPQISYSVTSTAPMSAATVSIASPEALTGETLEGFKDFLKENGFTEQQGENQFFNPENRAVANIMLRDWSPQVVYEFVPIQERPYPTFDKFPFSLLGFGKDTRETIMAWEKEHHGTYDPFDPIFEDPNEPVHFLFFTVDDPDHKWQGNRGYYVTDPLNTGTKTLLATTIEIKDISLVYFQSGKYTLLTEEFKALMQEEGFTYDGRKQINESGSQADIFVNKERELLVRARAVQYEGEANPLVEFFVTTYTDTED